MRNGTYTPKRRNTANTTFSGAYYGMPGRNRNMVKMTGNFRLGNVSTIIILLILVVFAGITYVGQSTRATSYDYEISSLEAEINDLEAQKEDLAVERARLNSIANSSSSTVAANMEDAHVSAYAE